MVGSEGCAVVSDMHLGTLAGAIAFALARPQHAGLLASLFGDLDVVSPGHVSDVLVPGALETLHQPLVSTGVHYSLGPGV